MRQAARPQSFYIKSAESEDEAVIRKLLRDAPMQGAVHLSLQREPDANLAAGVEGRKHHTMLVLNSDDEQVLGIGSRSVRPLYVNGEVCSVGYLGQLRVNPGRMGIRRLVAGYRAIGQTHNSDELAFDITSVIEDNKMAVRMLERGLRGMPHYRRLTRLTTFLIPASSRVVEIQNDVDMAGADDLSGIVSCLQEYLPRYQFSPYWDEQAILDESYCNNLSVNDFLIIRDGGKVSSCLAIWDQKNFKQVIINGYSRTLSIVRPLLNMLLSVLRKPRLPKAPCALNMAYLSHMAIRNDNPQEFIDLICMARQVAFKREIDYLVIGLTCTHPLHEVMSSTFPSYEYVSNLYTVHWDRSNPDVLNGRIPHVEVAVL